MDIRAYCAERRFKPATRERWLGLPATDGAALLGLAGDLRLGENQLRDLWDWCEEIASRDHTTIAAVLDDVAVREARSPALGRNDRLARTRTALRRFRFPELSRAETRLTELVRALALPAHVEVTLPANLEGDALHVQITAATRAQLETAVAALARATASPECAEIFDRLA